MGNIELPLKESWLCKSLASKGQRILADEKGWNVWGCAPIFDEDGNVHVFFSRWPGGHDNWIANSEIAHAVASKPEGPYTVTGTVLKGRGNDYWDADTVHNPSVTKVGNQYVMVFIGNNIANSDGEGISTQKIGIATAFSPEGPWARIREEPVLDVSENRSDWDSYCVVNPSLVVHPAGRFWLYYRAWDRYNDDKRKIGVAISYSLEGTYTKHPANPLIDNQKYNPIAQCEDPFVFFYENKFHCVVKDMGLQNYLSGLYYSSGDGISWSDPQQAYFRSDNYMDEPKDRFERPQILMKDDIPTYFFWAFMGGKNNSSGAVVKINL